MSWFTFSLLSITALATAELLQQHLLNSKQALSERTSAVLTFLGQALIALVIVLLSPFRDQITTIFQPDIFFKILIVTFIAAIAAIFYFRSFKVKNISFSTIFMSGSVVVSTLLGIIFFNETTSVVKFAGILMVLGAIVFANFKNSSLEKNHFYGLAAAVCFGISYTLDKSIVAQIHPLIYIMWAFFFVSVWGFLFNPKEVIRSVRTNQAMAFLPVAFSAGAYFLYNLFTFLAYRYGGEVGKVDAINNSQIFLIILFEFFILKHKQSVGKKIIAAFIAFLGVIILGLISS